MNTSPKNQDALHHNAPKPAEHQPRRGELLFDCSTRDGRTVRCELFDHGDYGVEARFSGADTELMIARRFDQRMDPTRTPRALALQWAEEERKVMESNP